MRRAADFLSRQQLDSNPPAMRAHHRMNPSGGYCFSARWHGWPVSDCTAEATLALLGIRTDDFHHDPSRHAAAARFILQMQNPDGGFGSYERRKTSWSLNWLNSAEMFDNSVTETSYVECTASCVRALVALRPIMSGPLLAECDRAVRRAARFLLRHQHVSGMWQGEWGVHCIYGTLFGLLGLSAALHSVHAPAIRKACRWLAAQQLPDGGWGEDHAGCIQRRFIPLESGRVVQTSWALIALLEVRWPDWEVIERGAGHLVSTLSSDGLWPKQEPAGVFFRSALLDYTLYRQIFPLWALGLYQQRRMERSRLDS
jgi:squalene/oxidosqualene cyclase-like protein